MAKVESPAQNKRSQKSLYRGHGSAPAEDVNKIEVGSTPGAENGDGIRFKMQYDQEADHSRVREIGKR